MSGMVSADTCQSQCKISKEENKILFEEREGSEDGLKQAMSTVYCKETGKAV